MLAEGRDGLHGEEESRSPHRLRFVVLAYADVVEIVARFGRYDHAGVAVNCHADGCMLGRKLVELLYRKTEETRAPGHVEEKVAKTKRPDVLGFGRSRNYFGLATG